jgi:hypothetical protein
MHDHFHASTEADRERELQRAMKRERIERLAMEDPAYRAKIERRDQPEE